MLVQALQNPLAHFTTEDSLFRLPPGVVPFREISITHELFDVRHDKLLYINSKLVLRLWVPAAHFETLFASFGPPREFHFPVTTHVWEAHNGGLATSDIRCSLLYIIPVAVRSGIKFSNYLYQPIIRNCLHYFWYSTQKDDSVPDSNSDVRIGL